jgi:hypothetical protein
MFPIGSHKYKEWVELEKNNMNKMKEVKQINIKGIFSWKSSLILIIKIKTTFIFIVKKKDEKT